MVDVSTDRWVTFGREIDLQSVTIASAVCRQYIGELSIGQHEKGTRILPAKAKYKSTSKIYKSNKGKDKQSVIGKVKTQEAC